MTKEKKKSLLHKYYDERFQEDYLKYADDLEWRRISFIMDHVENSVNMILDYGCGNGRWLPFFASLYPNARFFGTDPSTVALEQAKGRAPFCKFRHLAKESAPFDNALFDLLFSYHVLEHVQDLDLAVADMARVTKPGGHMLVIFPCGNKDSFEQKLAQVAIKGREYSDARDGCFYFEDPSHRRRLTSKEIISIFNSHGIFLKKQYFANQFWGALEWISKDNPDFLATIFDSRRAGTPFGRWRMGAWRRFFLTIHQMKKWRFMYGKLLITRAIDYAAWQEWIWKRDDPRGSAQYLLFSKPED